MDVLCTADLCPVILNATCVFYEGNTLLYTGITTNDNLQTALQKIDAKFGDAMVGYTFTNGVFQSAAGAPVGLGGNLTTDVTIGGNYTLTFAGNVRAAKHITTGGTASQFVKGDGTLDSTAYQAAGNYITALTGDVIAAGPGSVAASLAVVNSNPGTYGSGTRIPVVTVDTKGRVTALTTTAIVVPSGILSFVGDVFGSGTTGSATTLTLSNVNTNVYANNTFLKFKVNAKGLVTGAAPITHVDIEGVLGYVPTPETRKLSINGVQHDLQSDIYWDIATGVGSVTASAPLVSSGGATPNISIPKADATTDGYLDNIDWVAFNAKQAALNGTGLVRMSGTTVTYDNTAYTPQSRTLTINGVTFDLSANRSWTITSMIYPAAGIAVSTGTAWGTSITDNSANWNTAYTERISSSSSPLSILNHIISIAQAGASADGYLSSTDWNTFNNKQPAGSYVTTSRTISTTGPLQGGGDLSADRTLSITQSGASTDGYLSSTDWNTFNNKQASGSYITALTGEATATGPGSATVTLSTPAVTGKLLTGVNITGGTVVATDTILEAFGKVQNQINGLIGGSIYQGVWNASTNTPTLTSSVGTNGYYYIVNVAGSTNLNGITDWKVGDWAIFHDTIWQKVDNTDAVVSVNGYTGAVSLVSSDIPEGLTNLYYTPARARTAISLTTTGTSGAATYDNITGVLNVPVYTPDLSGYVPITRTLSINGTTYDLSANRSWTVSGTMPAGGTAGQILSKIDATDYNTEWIDNYATQVKNEVKLGATLAKGTPVYESGADGTNIIVSAASNTTEATSSKTFGLLETGGSTNAFVKCVTYGLLAGLDTSAAGAAGDPVWLGPNGTLLYGLANKPYAPAHMVYIGVVTRKQSNNGEIFVNIQNGFEMDELHNVSARNPDNNAILAYSTATSLWEKNTIAGVLGYTPVTSARTLTINGTAFDLTANRSWSVGTVTSVAQLTIGTTGTDITSSVATGTTTPVITLNIPTASATNRGALSAADWSTFNSKQPALGYTPVPQTRTLTINGTAYDLSADRSWTISTYSLPIATASVLGGVKIGGGVSIDAGGVISVSTNYQAPLSGTGFVKSTAGVISYDTSTYYLASNPSGFITSSGTAAAVSQTVTGTNSAELVRGNMADNDQFRILVGGTASNAGFVEIATADDGNEPIHVRQYTGVFSTLQRTATLLDASGNTSFPGTVTAPTFSGALSGTASGNVVARGQSNWNDSTVINNVVGMLGWKNYGNGHVIFDASQGTSPSGSAVNATNSAVAWTGTYPTLMGWNGSTTYGVRVDTARYADSAGSATSATTAATATNSGQLNGITAVMLYNNMNQTHGTRVAFDASTPSYDFGYRYVQGSGNGPGTGGSQYYSWYIGLGSDYPATGAGSYGAMFAVDRNTTGPYLSVRYNENNSFGSWRRINAGYADSAGSASSATTSSTVTHLSGRTDSENYNVVWAAGNPSHMYSCNAVTIQSSSGTLTATNLTATSNVRGNDVYTTGGWFRNHTNNSGIYWANTGWHLYPKNASDFYFHSGTTDASIQFQRGGTNANYIHNSAANEIGFLSTGRGWIFRVTDGGSGQLYGDLTVGSGGSSNIYMVDSDEGQRQIHCNSNRIGFLTQSGNWGSWCDDDGGWQSAASISAGNAVYSGNYFYSYGNAGWYNATYDQGLRQSKGNVSFGNVITQGENFNGWGGYNITNSTITAFMQNSSGTHGFYQENNAGWVLFWNAGNACWGMGTDATSGSYSLHIPKYGGSDQGWIIWSDRRIKENIKTIDNALDKVLSLRGVYYNKIDDPNKERCVGYIAQEVMEVVPELVVYSEELDMYNMNYGPMVAMLTEAIKEQQAQIEELKQQVQTLLNS